MFGAMKSLGSSLSPLAQQLMQRAQGPQQAGPPPESPSPITGQPQGQGPQAPPPDPLAMNQVAAQSGMQGQGMGKPMPPPNWMAPAPQGDMSTFIQGMNQNMQGMNNKLKVSDPYGGTQEASSQPPESALPAAPPWVQQMMGQLK